MTPTNNHKPESQQPEQNQAEFMVGALIGAVAGAAAAILLTPKSGKEMRHTVKEYAKEFEGEAYELAQEAKDVTKSLRQVIDEGVSNIAETAPDKVDQVTQQAQNVTAAIEQHITAARDTVADIAEAFRSGWEEYGEVIEEAKELAEDKFEEMQSATTPEEDSSAEVNLIPNTQVPGLLAAEIEELTENQPQAEPQQLNIPEDSLLDDSPQNSKTETLPSTDEVDAIAPLQSRRRGQVSHLFADTPDDTPDDQLTTQPEDVPEPAPSAKPSYSTKVIEEVKPARKLEKTEADKPTKTRSVKVEAVKEDKKPGKKLFFRKK